MVTAGHRVTNASCQLLHCLSLSLPSRLMSAAAAAAPRRVAVVTGGNKGIGYAVCKALASHTSPPITVLLGSRDEQRGREAVERLRGEQQQYAVDVQPLVIDIADQASVTRAADRVAREWGGLDILVNNAGIASKGDAFDEKIARDTLRTNYWGQPHHSPHCWPPHMPPLTLWSAPGSVM